MVIPPPKRSAARLRILLVEDDADTAHMMVMILERSGFDARSASSYKEALASAADWVPDLLICDIGLPGKDGLEVMKKMRDAYPGLRGLVVSGHTSPEDVARSREAGFADHLAKPLDVDRLKSAIQHLFAEP